MDTFSSSMVIRMMGLTTRTVLLASLATGWTVAAACSEKDDIRVYAAPAAPAPPPVRTAPAASPAKPPAEPHGAATGGEARLLAAIVPRGNEVWHFMVMGPAAEVAKQRDAVLRVIEDLKFAEKDDDGRKRTVPTWHLPPGWQEKPGTGFRYATLLTGEPPKGLEIRITPLGPESAEPMPNIQRYAGMVGLTKAAEKELAAAAKTIKVDGKDAVWVELTGPGGGAGPARPPVAQPPPAEKENLITKAPAGWTEPAQLPPFASAAYELADGQRKASLTVSKVGGDIKDNMNRWRSQVGLPEWSDEDFKKAALGGQGIEVGAIGERRSLLIDFTGPESAGDKRDRIVGALVAGSGGADIWYIKLRGPADLVGKQKEAFDAFLQAMRFEAEK